MLIRWNDIDNAFALLDEARREMDQWVRRMTEGGDTPALTQWTSGWPRMQFVDMGKELVLVAEVPGLSEKDFNVSVNQDVLTVSGERKTTIPEGYQTHRHERPSVKFSRSFALPCKVDLEKTTAVAKNGILTIKLPKAPESQPRQIQVTSN